MLKGNAPADNPTNCDYGSYFASLNKVGHASNFLTKKKL